MRSQASEKAIVKSIRTALEVKGWWTLKIHGGPYQSAGIPDLLCLREGRYVWLEVKRSSGKVTPLQAHVHEQLRNRGAEVFTVRSREEAIYACR